MQNITQVFRNELNLRTMSRVIRATGLQQLLSGPGPFTVFAPSDLAFKNMGQEVVADLLLTENRLQLVDLLSNHIVLGHYLLVSFKDGEKIRSLLGKELVVEIALGTVSIDGATILNGDISSSNGIIHLLNKVLMN